MKFSFGGSSGNWWSKFAKNFTNMGGEVGKFGKGFTTSLSNTRDYLAEQGGGTIGEQLLHRENPTGRLSGGLDQLSKNTMGWSRQLKPLWEGGLTKSGGTFKDIFGNEEEGGLLSIWAKKAGHHLFGREIPGYGESGKDDGGGGEGGSAVVTSDTEDPSLINQGNWQNADTIASFLRREDMLNRGGLATDLTKSKRGRLNVANLA